MSTGFGNARDGIAWQRSVRDTSIRSTPLISFNQGLQFCKAFGRCTRSFKDISTRKESRRAPRLALEPDLFGNLIQPLHFVIGRRAEGLHRGFRAVAPARLIAERLGARDVPPIAGHEEDR